MVTRAAWLRHVAVRSWSPSWRSALARAALLPGVAFWDTGELQTVGPLLGTAHPTGFPTYVLLGWLASVVLQPLGEPAFRMNLLSRSAWPAAAGLTVDLVRALTRSTPWASLAGLGLALTPVAWAIGTHADAHALHLVFVALLLRLLLAWESGALGADGAGAGAAARRGRPRRSLPRRGGGRVRPGRRQPLADPAPGARRSACSSFAVEPRDPAASRPRRSPASAALAVDRRARLPRAAAPRRALPGAAGLRPARHLGRLLVRRPRPAVPGQPRSTRSATCRASSRDLVGLAAGQFGPLAVLIPFGFVATVRRRPRYALLTGVVARADLLLRGVLRERRHRPLLPRAGR